LDAHEANHTERFKEPGFDPWSVEGTCDLEQTSYQAEIDELDKFLKMCESMGISGSSSSICGGNGTN
jgi:hypothetical protein